MLALPRGSTRATSSSYLDKGPDQKPVRVFKLVREKSLKKSQNLKHESLSLFQNNDGSIAKSKCPVINKTDCNK